MIRPKRERAAYQMAGNDARWPVREEKKIARQHNAVQMPASGATPFLKGDMVLHDYMLDAKSTKHGQVVVTVAMLSKLEDDAMRHTKKPALVLNYVKAPKLRHKRWLVIPLE